MMICIYYDVLFYAYLTELLVNNNNVDSHRVELHQRIWRINLLREKHMNIKNLEKETGHSELCLVRVGAAQSDADPAQVITVCSGVRIKFWFLGKFPSVK